LHPEMGTGFVSQERRNADHKAMRSWPVREATSRWCFHGSSSHRCDNLTTDATDLMLRRYLASSPSSPVPSRAARPHSATFRPLASHRWPTAWPLPRCDTRVAFASTAADAALARTLDEALKRGDVTAEHGTGTYVVSGVLTEINEATVNRWRKVREIPPGSALRDANL
jgi:hypothetical protein